MNYVPFAEAVVKLVVELYKVTANHPAVLQGRVLENIVKVGGWVGDNRETASNPVAHDFQSITLGYNPKITPTGPKLTLTLNSWTSSADNSLYLGGMPSEDVVLGREST